ncbi:hypothetical protein D3C78_1991140 [compost metagenome]
MLAGGIHANQFVLPTQHHDPFAERTAGTDPTLGKGLDGGGRMGKQNARAQAGQTDN